MAKLPEEIAYNFNTELNINLNNIPFIGTSILSKSCSVEEYDSDIGEKFISYSPSYNYNKYRDYFEVKVGGEILYAGQGRSHPTIISSTENVKYPKKVYNITLEYTAAGNQYLHIGRLIGMNAYYHSTSRIHGAEGTAYYFAQTAYLSPLNASTDASELATQVTLKGDMQSWNGSEWTTTEANTERTVNWSGLDYTLTIVGLRYIWSGGSYVLLGTQTVKTKTSGATYEGTALLMTSVITRTLTFNGYVPQWDTNWRRNIGFYMIVPDDYNELGSDMNRARLAYPDFSIGDITILRNNPSPENIESEGKPSIVDGYQKKCFFKISKDSEDINNPTKEKYRLYIEGKHYKLAPDEGGTTKDILKYDDTWTWNGSIYVESTNHSVEEYEVGSTAGNDIDVQLLVKYINKKDYNEVRHYKK